MTGRVRGAFLALAMLLGVVAFASPAQAGDASPCKEGGYVNYVDPATGQPFKNQGQCVSFVRRGGNLVPVEEEPPPPVEPTFEFTSGWLTGNFEPIWACSIRYEAWAAPGQVVSFGISTLNGVPPVPQSVTTLSTGEVAADEISQVATGTVITAVLDGETYTSSPAYCGPAFIKGTLNDDGVPQILAGRLMAQEKVEVLVVDPASGGQERLLGNYSAPDYGGFSIRLSEDCSTYPMTPILVRADGTRLVGEPFTYPSC